MTIAEDWGSDPGPEPEPDEMGEIRFNQRVSQRAEEIRVLDAARARVAAEREAGQDFAGLYLSRRQLLDLPAPEPLIRRVLPRHSYAILRGRDHSFKSFVAVDWACCLATGKPWQNHVATPTRVLYIAGEGAHGLAGRIEAWEYAWQTDVPDDMLTVRRTALNMHTPGPAYADLLCHVEQGGYGLVIVDTLRRVSGAADGNGSEMGTVIDNLDRIKHATADGSVLVVAHTDKGDHDTRGYSGIEDDADVVWAAQRKDMYLTLQLTKNKDGIDGTRIDLQAQPTGVGSLILAGGTGTPELDTTDSQRALLAALAVMPEGGVTGNDLMATADLKKPTLYRALKYLIGNGQIVRTKTGRTYYYQLPGLIDDATTEPPDDPDDDPDDDPLPIEPENSQ